MLPINNTDDVKLKWTIFISKRWHYKCLPIYFQTSYLLERQLPFKLARLNLMNLEMQRFITTTRSCKKDLWMGYLSNKFARNSPYLNEVLHFFFFKITQSYDGSVLSVYQSSVEIDKSFLLLKSVNAALGGFFQIKWSYVNGVTYTYSLLIRKSVRIHKGYIFPNLVNGTLLIYSYTFLSKSRDLSVMIFIKPVKLVWSKKQPVAWIFLDATIAEME